MNCHPLLSPNQTYKARAAKPTKLAFVLALLGVVFISGCQPAHLQIDRQAAASGLTRATVEGASFRHVAYLRNDDAPAATVHIYIEGDGRPWISGQWVSPDPTPRKALALQLMMRDPTVGIYLGRPCYFGTQEDQPCHERYWTNARYAEDVVDSMAAAARLLLAKHGDASVVLIGHSGGGALAVLLADRIPGVTGVITIAGNLDTDGWTEQHGYLTLDKSLNPMQSAKLDSIAHLHYAGAKDSNVAPDLIEAFSRQHGGHFLLEPDHNHGCCWEQDWPRLLPAALRLINNSN